MTYHFLTISDSRIDKSICKINNELTKIDYWRINKLSINYIQTKFMIIGKKNMITTKLKLVKMKLNKYKKLNTWG